MCDGVVPGTGATFVKRKENWSTYWYTSHIAIKRDKCIAIISYYIPTT